MRVLDRYYQTLEECSPGYYKGTKAIKFRV